MSFIDLHTNVSLGHTKIVGLGGEKLWLCPTLGGDKLDISGNGNHGTYNGGIRTVADVSNGGTRAYSFDGVDDYIDVDNGITCGGHSVACWIYADTTSLRMRFIDSYDRSVSTTLPQNVIQHEANTGIRAFSQISGNAIGSFTSINASQWYHIVSVLDGSDLRFYIDGSLVDTVAYTPTPDVDWVRIGARNNGGERVDGRMDDIRIFDRALTTSEITHLASKRGVLGTPRNPVIKKRRIFYAPTAPVTTTAKAVVLKKPKPSSLQIDTQSQLNAGLRSWWSANSVDTSKFVDSSNKLHGEWTAGSPIYSYCEKTKRHAVDFSNTEIQTASAKRFYNFTMCCWVKINYAASDTFARIFEHGLNNSVTLNLNKNAARNKFYFQGLGTGGSGAISTTNISGDWQHVSIKYNGLTQYIYVDGNLEDTYARGSFASSSQVWHFGRNSGAASVTRLNGSIADVRYFNRAISDGQIKSIYLNPAAPFERKQQTVGLSTAAVVPSANFNPFSVLTHPLEQ